MDLKTLTDELLDALQNFDTEVLPLGLYASDDLVADRPPGPKFQEWHRALYPLLRSYGVRGPKFDEADANVSMCRCSVPEVGLVEIVLVKFSNIKVRKHGSGYHVDQ